jgi:hypothetical protein
MLTAWLLRSDEYPLEKYWAVVDLLQGFQGPIRFMPSEESIPVEDEELIEEDLDKDNFDKQKKRNPRIQMQLSESRFIYSLPPRYTKISWSHMFAKCHRFRVDKHIRSKDFVILLTEHVNEYNWFTGGDPSGAHNLFVHTAFWGYFSGSDQRFPVAYHIVAAILKALTFKDYADLAKYLHKNPVGCINDFCEEKRDVVLKLRTADICPSCLSIIQERGVNPLLVKQVLQIIEGLREQMLFKHRWKVQDTLPTMVVSGYNRNIIFPELGDLKIRLSPLEKTLYLLFLQKPKGIKIAELGEHKAEMVEIYGALYTGAEIEAIPRQVAELCNPLSNSASEKISRIRTKFNDALGSDLAQHYIIQGPNGKEKKIEVKLKKNVSEREQHYGST